MIELNQFIPENIVKLAKMHTKKYNTQHILWGNKDIDIDIIFHGLLFEYMLKKDDNKLNKIFNFIEFTRINFSRYNKDNQHWYYFMYLLNRELEFLEKLKCIIT